MVTVLVTVAYPVVGLLELNDGFVVMDAVTLLELLNTCGVPELIDHWYSDSLKGPPHTWELFPMQTIEHRPSVVDVLPLMSAFPQ